MLVQGLSPPLEMGKPWCFLFRESMREKIDMEGWLQRDKLMSFGLSFRGEDMKILVLGDGISWLWREIMISFGRIC